MEFFKKAKAVKLRCHNNKYLVADDDQEKVRQSRNGLSQKARWLVELVENNTQVVRLKSCHGRYLTASNAAFLTGMTGNKVLQTEPENRFDMFIDWQPVKDGNFQVKLRAFGGTFLRANGGPPPWRNSVTHDSPYTNSTQKWILWNVEAVNIPENESLKDYLSMVSSISSLSDDLYESELGSPVSIQSTNSPRFSIIKSTNSPRLSIKKSGMDLFYNAKAVRLQSSHDKYLHADDDEETVFQDRNGSAKTARWTVEFVEYSAADNTIIRLKSCFGKYLTASNHPFLLGMTGRKVLQTLPAGRLDSSVEWEPIREGNQVKLKTRYGHFLRANGGVPPWRNSVTHDIPHRSATQDWILWNVDIVEILPQSPRPMPLIQSVSVPHSDSFAASEPSSPSAHSNKSPSFGREEELNESFLGGSPPKAVDGRTIYYRVADYYGNVDEGVEEHCITFKGNVVDELTQRMEEETGLDDIVVCSRNPFNGKLYPLRLQLPPNNATMHVVVLESSSKVARDFAKSGTPL